MIGEDRIVAFLFSFFVILVMWINHHEFMRWVRAVDYAVVARYLGTEAARTAVAVRSFFEWPLTRVVSRPAAWASGRRTYTSG